MEYNETGIYLAFDFRFFYQKKVEKNPNRLFNAELWIRVDIYMVSLVIIHFFYCKMVDLLYSIILYINEN